MGVHAPGDGGGRGGGVSPDRSERKLYQEILQEKLKEQDMSLSYYNYIIIIAQLRKNFHCLICNRKKIN